jgi:integrase
MPSGIFIASAYRNSSLFILYSCLWFTPIYTSVYTGRGFSMATFKKEGDRHRAWVCVNGVRKSKRFDTKAHAKSWAAQTEYELGQMRAGVDSVATLGDVFVRYANEVSALKKGEQWEVVRLKMFERFAVAGIELVDLRREHFDDYIRERSGAVKSSSINRELNLMSHCLTQARRWRMMDHNPMEDLKRPKDPPGRDRRISPREVETILIALNYSDRYPAVQQQQKVAVAFLFAIETAMRAGEICSLVAKNIDLGQRTALLPETKNGYSRHVPLSSEAVRLLGRFEWGETSVFGFTSNTLSTLFKRAVNKTDIVDLTFHDTRHEAITRLAKKLDVLDLARMSGHRDIKQLLTYYNKSAAELAAQLD